MSTRAKIEFVCAALVLAAVVMGFRAWLAEHDARMAADATAKQQTAVLVELQKDRDQLAAQDKERDAQAAATIAQLTRAAASETTPQQIAAWLPKQIPLPAPISIQAPVATASNPAPPAIATIPDQDLAPLRDLLVKAQSCAIELPAAQKDLTSCQAQLKLAGDQLAAVEKERDAYKKASKGTFWSRTLTALKWGAIGGAIGAGAVLAGKK